MALSRVVIYMKSKEATFLILTYCVRVFLAKPLVKWDSVKVLKMKEAS